MSALNLFNVIPQCSTCTMVIKFSDELFPGFKIICSLTGLWYGQEELGYPALLIPLECFIVNICATDIFQNVISLQLNGYTRTDWQFHVAQILLFSIELVKMNIYQIFNVHYMSF
jgi:hypothetical protein